MSKKRHRAKPFSELLISLPPAVDWYGTGLPSPAGVDEFLDGEGGRWRKVRGPFERRLAKRLLTSADVVIVGEGVGTRLRRIPLSERLEFWTQVNDRFNTADTPGYEPYQFVSPDGLTLLYIEENC
ncbi:hypothetical protein [Kitasatospora sp. NPDC088134]|uniref:hypothetical protein n=1 Tax=Kitasatospora sp. NPDC088134 TaxID=3364071 RepID=UPI00383048CE